MKVLVSPFIIDFAAFQVVWFACVLSSKSTYPLLLPIIATIIASSRVLSVSKARPNLTIGLACLILGLIGDGLLVHFGIVVFEESLSWVGVPIWMLCLWFSFGLFLKRLFGWFIEKYTKSLFGFSIGGALAYLGGSKLGALTMGHSLAFWAIAIEWGVVGLVLCWVSQNNLLTGKAKERHGRD